MFGNSSLCAAHSSIRFQWLALLLGASFALTTTPAIAQFVLQIEEHWELQVGGPNTAHSAPQVTMIMSPTSNLDHTFFSFAINYWSFPDFAPGGYQLQRWYGEDCVQSLHGWNTNTLESDGEVISWVQRLSIVDGNLRFQVLNGDSVSWSTFGGEGFSITTPTNLTYLNDYVPAISIQQSGIGYAGNRVSSLILQRLTWVTDDGEEHELVAPIDIDTDLDP